MDKQSLRAWALKEREAISDQTFQLMNEQVINQLRTLLLSLKIRKISSFYPMRGEIDLRSLSKDFEVYLPKVGKQGLMFYKDTGHYASASFGTTVPNHNQAIESKNLEAVIVPGLVFDETFYRIGYGKGYYDVFLSSYEGLKVGVCFNRFILKQIPTEPHDMPVDIMITESQLRRK